MDDRRRIQIFRAEDSQDFLTTDAQVIEPSEFEGFDKMAEAGSQDGSEVRVLMDLPGCNLTYNWFGREFMLPLHSHNVDCAYFIISGSLTMGTETLRACDTFFVPANAAYTYQAGPEGVEVLEIRFANHWDFRNLAKGSGFFDRAVEVIARNRDGWRAARAPSLAR
jgi:hypothetical protein